MKGLFYFARRKVCLANSVESSEGGSSIVIDPCSSLPSSSEPKGGNKTENSLSLGQEGGPDILDGPFASLSRHLCNHNV